jgi:hypothetical protein
MTEGLFLYTLPERRDCENQVLCAVFADPRRASMYFIGRERFGQTYAID